MSYQTKVYQKQGGDELVVASGGTITIESGGNYCASVASINAAGSNSAGATAIAVDWAIVAAADDAKGVKLPTGVAGKVVRVKNTVSNKALLVYPHTGGTINAGSANGAATQAAATEATFVCVDGTNWQSFNGTLS